MGIKESTMDDVNSLRWEHALLAATISKATEACPECAIGRIAVQKLLYFMNVLGVPMQYQFEIYHYGPYCSSVASDIEWLLADDVLVNESNSAAYRYRTSPKYETVSREFREQLSEQMTIIEAVARTFGSLPPSTLELVATLDFSFRWVHASGSEGPWKTATVEKFKRIKKEKFSNESIDQWYGKLVELGLIQP